MLTKIQIRNYKGIKRARLPLSDENGYLPHLVIGSKHTHIMANAINPLDATPLVLEYIQSASDPDKAQEATENFFRNTDENIKMKFAFDMEQTTFAYEIQMGAEGVQKEYLFVDQSLQYTLTSKMRKSPRYPKGTSKFFKEIVSINLASFEQVNKMVNAGIKYCHDSKSTLDLISFALNEMKVTDKPLRVAANEKDNVYIYDENLKGYMSIHNASRTIQTVFGFLAIITVAVAHQRILVVRNFHTLDFSKKVKILHLHRKLTTGSLMSQMICFDKMDTGYEQFNRAVQDFDLKKINYAYYTQDLSNEQFILNVPN
jgi:hypothetical protein